MKRFVLDTNIYIAAARDRRFGAELVQFAGSYLPQLYLHAVVVQELMAGAIHEEARRRLEREVIQPFEKRGRIVLPSCRAWKRSGEIIAALVKAKVLTAGGVSRSFTNDAVLAASCREGGVTVIMWSEADFQRISKIERVSFVGPWPQPERQDLMRVAAVLSVCLLAASGSAVNAQQTDTVFTVDEPTSPFWPAAAGGVVGSEVGVATGVLVGCLECGLRWSRSGRRSKLLRRR